jgi:hypothetical protein
MKRASLYFSMWCALSSGLFFASHTAECSEEAELDAGTTARDEENGVEDMSSADIRDKIIALIEHDLSNAYSYTSNSPHALPHFEVIDKIFPKWHHGNPAVARQFWVRAGYRRFVVFYRVDYVYVMSEAAAKVEGKRLVIWSENEEETDLEKFWPFQLWAALQKQTHRDNTYLSSAYTMRFKMSLSLNEKGEWIVADERFLDNPEMMNNIKDNCLFEKQMQDWGLKNDCNKKLLPM